MRLSSVQVLATIAYCDQFDFPLSAAEVWQRMIPFQFLPFPTAAKKNEQGDVKKILARLVQQQRLIKSGDWFALPGRDHLFALRQERAQLAKRKNQEIQHFLSWAKQVPWVQAIFVTGSLAMENAQADDDADFMIVTNPNRLWLTRILLVGIALMHGKRRSWRGEEKRSWCLNLWLDENHLAIEEPYRDVYRAYEVIQARPVFSRGKQAQLFWQANEWVKEFLPNWEVTTSTQKKRGTPQRTFFLLDGFDWLVWQLQVWYMSSHRTSERVGRGFAFFHPRDTKKIIMNRWQQTIKELLQ